MEWGAKQRFQLAAVDAPGGREGQASYLSGIQIGIEFALKYPQEARELADFALEVPGTQNGITPRLAQRAINSLVLGMYDPRLDGQGDIDDLIVHLDRRIPLG